MRKEISYNTISHISKLYYFNNIGKFLPTFSTQKSISQKT